MTIIKQGLLLPKQLVNLKKISHASEIDFDSKNGLRIGALATINAIETSLLVRQHYPALAEACHVVANIRIRNMATIGGNLAHGDYQSDPPTVLAALDARIEIMSATGCCELSLADFQRGSYETALLPSEVISAVIVPALPSGMAGRYVTFTTGSSEERPCAGVAVFAHFENGICRELRLAVGAVSPCAVRISAAEESARDMILTDQLIAAIASEAARAVEPIDDLRGPAEYTRHVVRGLVRRAIAALANGSAEASA